jgi:nickel-dependent lactate racemase
LVFAEASVHAYRKAGCHFVAMEGDKEIFKAILEPLTMDPVSEALKKKRREATSTADVLEIDELLDPVITPLNQYCK